MEKQKKRIYVSLILVLLMGVLIACSPGPEAVIDDFYQALEDEDIDAAMDLFNEDRQTDLQLQFEFLIMFIKDFAERDLEWEVLEQDIENDTAFYEVKDNVMEPDMGSRCVFHLTRQQDGRWLIDNMGYR